MKATTVKLEDVIPVQRSEEEMTDLDPNQILTPGELAGRLKVPKTWVYEKTRSRSLDSLPFFRVGKYLRFYWPNVVAWLERHKN